MVSLNRSLHTLCILIRLSCKELFKLSKVPYWLVIHSLNLDADSLLWKIQLIFVDFNSVSKRLEIAKKFERTPCQFFSEFSLESF